MASLLARQINVCIATPGGKAYEFECIDALEIDGRFWFVNSPTYFIEYYSKLNMHLRQQLCYGQCDDDEICEKWLPLLSRTSVKLPKWVKRLCFARRREKFHNLDTFLIISIPNNPIRYISLPGPCLDCLTIRFIIGLRYNFSWQTPS